ncbi:thioredoxin [Candidatus Uhrbacteria bacterium CG_4_10_14_0_2_um_filter_41_21]|nr:MAG: thioredoxin [Candidatus Uhrbacteria bacterium CG_4_10_14_0_2_um_filter_41_21]
MTKIITKETFDLDVLEVSKEKPVLVDFFAQWCMPCKMMAPILDDLSEDVGKEAVIVKVDVDEERQLAEEFGIMSIPTMYIFREGKIVEKMVGLKAQEELKTMLESHK